MKKSNFIKIIFLLLIGSIFITNNAHAQIEQFYESWRWTHFTTKTGLQSDVVEDILEADDSTVWVSTSKGIAWYDGFRWTPVIVDSLFPEQRVRKIAKYHKDKIFVILNGALYCGDKHGFIKISINDIPKPGIISSVLSLESNSFLFIYEYSDTSSIFIVKNNVVKSLDVGSKTSIFNSFSNDWYAAGGKKGLYSLNKKNWNIIFKKFEYSITLQDIAKNKNGKIIFAIESPKQFIGIWEYYDDKIVYSKSERNQPVRALDISTFNEVIVVYESGKVHLRKYGVWENIDPLPRQMTNIHAVKYRNNNDIWIATEQGLYLFKRDNNQWASNKYSFSDLRNVVMEIFKSKEGDIWIGTMNGLEVQSKTGKKKFITIINGENIGLVTGINQDNHHHIWISTGAGFKGVYEWDGKRWYHHLNGIRGINIHKIRKDNSGDLWFLGLGIKSNDPSGYIFKNNKFIRIDSIFQLPSNRIYAFSESPNGTLWFGTSGGLSRSKNGLMKQWSNDEYLNLNVKVYTLAVDKNEKIWFSTFSPHLGTISQNDSIDWIWRNEEAHSYKQKVWDLSIDNAGVLWAATTNGLFRYYNSVWTNYSTETGFYIRELRVVLPTMDKIYVGGHGIGFGSIQRNNDSIPVKIYPARPIVEANEAHCSWEPISFWGALPSDQIETRYKLDNQNWSAWSTIHAITFKKLNSGDHRLLLQAKDTYGIIHGINDGTTFEIEPPAYFRLSYAIPFSVLLSGIGFVVFQYYKVQKNHKIFIKNQRTRIANDLHDEVGSNLGSIALISQRMSRKKEVSKTMKEDLNIISEAAIQTSEFLNDIVWYVNPRYDTFMNLETRLKEISQKMLRDVTVTFNVNDKVMNDENLVEIRRSIILMFKEILHNILKHSKATSVQINFERMKNHFKLSIKDNGVGFNQNQAYTGNGLHSLKKRANENKVNLEIQSQFGTGTEIILEFKNSVNT